MSEYADSLIDQMGWASNKRLCDWIDYAIQTGFNLMNKTPAEILAAYEGSR